MPGKYRGFISILLLLILIGILAAIVMVATQSPPPAPAVQAHAGDAEFLAAAEKPRAQGFRFSDVPSWLFVHVGIIAALQTLSVLAAVVKAGKPSLSRSEIPIIQFLVEIPMYLGLFGTLLGVCLTQFVTGSLVAPVAYLTTMSGIVLHVVGKLTVLLPLSSGEVSDD